MELLLIRHAESVGNTEGRFQGQVDYPLSERGREQAAALARRMFVAPPDAVYASPLSRAWDTALEVAEASGKAAVALPAVMEYDFGAISGLTWQEILERYPEPAAVQRHGGGAFPLWPGEEGREVFQQRVTRSLYDLEARHAGQTVVVVSHAGPIQAFLIDVLQLPYVRPIPFTIENTSISVVQVTDAQPCRPSCLDPRLRGT